MPPVRRSLRIKKRNKATVKKNDDTSGALMKSFRRTKKRSGKLPPSKAVQDFGVDRDESHLCDRVQLGYPELVTDVGGITKEEAVHYLCQFDLDSRYGPCSDMKRSERFQRAVHWGLQPPVTVSALLSRFLDHPDMDDNFLKKFQV